MLYAFLGVGRCKIRYDRLKSEDTRLITVVTSHTHPLRLSHILVTACHRPFQDGDKYIYISSYKSAQVPPFESMLRNKKFFV